MSLTCSNGLPILNSTHDKTNLARENIHYGGTSTRQLDPLKILMRLEADVLRQMESLDDHLDGNKDPRDIIMRVEKLLSAADHDIRGFEIRALGLVTGQAISAAETYIRVVLSIVTHCAKWYNRKEFHQFLPLVQGMNQAGESLVASCGGVVGGLITFGTNVVLRLLPGTGQMY